MANPLAAEKSPYLLQHADNPVAWLPWGPAALAQARTEQKPVFLSIGYSTCHWCHVMAHESFEDPAIAALLNTHFIPVKVDREERPDVDKVYMTYVQTMTGHGGWPLSVWLTPELKPFYGGTYFPPEDRHGRTGLATVLRAIAQGWAAERDKLLAEAERMIGALRAHHNAVPGDDGADLAEAGPAAFGQCLHHLWEHHDPALGGFGGAPKFPRAVNLSFLFRCAVVQGADSEAGRAAVHMAAVTLQKMAQGGIHDHVGGGFHRYSVDAEWFVPHFEKMLYDQAQIAVNALDAHLATGDERHAWLARDVLGYVLRELAHPAGGFYSAEDADSAVAAAGPKAEGAFYVWTRAEIEAGLSHGAGAPPPRSAAEDEYAAGAPRPHGQTPTGHADAAFFCDHFGVTAEGNVPAAQDPHGEFTGRNILRQRQPLAVTARAHGLDPQVASDRLAAVLEKLRTVRARRPRPQLDDKIITAWNGLMIGALARAAASPADCLAEDRARYRAAAERAADFIARELFDDGRGVLYRSWRGGRGAAEAFAEDYAYLIAGLLDLYEATFESRWLRWAERLQQTMDAQFWDEAGGGYFNSAAGAADLVLRLKEDYDGAEPSPNSVAAANLLRLAAVFDGFDAGGSAARGENAPPAAEQRRRAERTIGAFRTQWQRAPQAMPEMLCAIERALEPPRQIVFTGDPASADFQALVAVGREKPGRRRALLHMSGGPATASLCEESTCQLPVSSPNALRALLRD